MDKVFHCQADLNCSPQEAYKYFTQKKLIQAWLVPVANVEARVGGSYELFWEPDDRENNSTIGCKVTAIKPGEFIAFEWKSPRQFKYFANSARPLTHCLVMFIPIKDGTRVHLVHSGWRNTPKWLAAAEWQQRAWSLALKELRNASHSIPIKRR